MIATILNFESGNVYQLGVPSGYTNEQLLAHLKDNFSMNEANIQYMIHNGSKGLWIDLGDIVNDSDKVEVNIVELSSELADDAAFNELCSKGIISDKEEMWDGENYTEIAQDVFNRWYDYFYDMINGFKV
jgi:hypothetical protein